MLRNADIDAVDICTGHAQHAPNTIAAAEAGKHVLVEKAMSNTLQGCRDMVEAADKAGTTLMVSQQLRYSADATAREEDCRRRETRRHPGGPQPHHHAGSRRSHG